MVRTGLFMNEDGNVFSACMTCEGELGRLLDGRKNEPLVPPAFITSAVLKVSLSHSAVVRMRAKARLLCKSNQVALPRIGIPPCVQAPWRRAAAPRAGCGPGEYTARSREHLDVLPVTLPYGTNPGPARFRRRSYQVTAGADSASITRCLYEWTRVGRRAPEGGGRTGS